MAGCGCQSSERPKRTERDRQRKGEGAVLTSVGRKHHTRLLKAVPAVLFMKSVFAGPCACSANIAASTPQKRFRKPSVMSCSWGKC